MDGIIHRDDLSPKYSANDLMTDIYKWISTLCPALVPFSGNEQTLSLFDSTPNFPLFPK